MTLTLQREYAQARKAGYSARESLRTRTTRRVTLLTTESPTYLRRLSREIHAQIARSGVYYSFGEICRRIVDCKTRRVGHDTVLVLKCMGGTWLVFDVQVGHLQDGHGNHVVASRQS